ncbi:hypothetical protein [Sinomonas mesophila]|uniref:hypothetical protein n=1 Tax=Sinomonas mesophila TaxID=1531955 RepID=UPI0009857867|nr:hypothetical protein [Sinomonas mesophila]
MQTQFPPAQGRTPQGQPQRRLSTAMAANIGVLSLLTLVSVFVLMFGEFEGKIVRTISTLLVCGLFTAFAATDASRDKPQRYMVASQSGQVYMLCLSLILIWGSLAAPRTRGLFEPFDELQLFLFTLLIVGIVRGAVFLVQKASDWFASPQPQLALGTKATAALVALLAVLLSLPLGIGYAVEFPDTYWRITVALILLTGLAISISVLLAWSFRERPTARGSSDPSRPVPGQPPATAGPQPRPAAPLPPFAPPVPQARLQQAMPRQEYAAPVLGIQPWPVFPDGRPLPATPSGRPDFAALQYVVSMYVESERQWGGS